MTGHRPWAELAVKRRPLPDQLRYLAGKLTDGADPGTVALVLLTIAGEMSESPGAGSCCGRHGRNCEPAGELCCERCTEADHPAHSKLGPCSNPVLSPGSLTEARKIEAALAAERSRLFVAIRHAIGLDKPWRGEALDLIYGVWQHHTEDGERA